MDTTPNKKNLKNRSDYGVRVARPGYDANFCAQNQLLFNSGWPILQITSLVEVATMPIVSMVELEVNTMVVDTSTGSITSRTRVITYPDTVPEGWTTTNTYSYDPSANGGGFRTVSVNRKYIKKEIAGNRTSYIYPQETISGDGKVTYINKMAYVYPVAKKTHGLGFTPFFMTSDQISEISGYVVLFSVDIATDVDYPYTEKPLGIINPKTDYGLKSASKFGKRVPGLCSDMFSKLVQAVKTEETVADNSNGDLRVIWSPVNSYTEASGGELLPYEFYSFISDNSTGVGVDGGAYYRREYPFYMSRSNGGSELVDAWAVASAPFQTTVNTKNSLVVLRSPMVSPEYEEMVL